ncbi:MAG: carboxypeptidase-like regulatory domain-containing protein [Pyrinomonadaceae bacterium]
MHRTSHITAAARLAAVTVVSLLLFAVSAYAQSTGGVKGKVRSRSGAGIAGATVTARHKGVDLKTVKAGPKGEFVLDGLEPGLYNFVFEANGYSRGILYDVEVQRKKIADLGDRLVLGADEGTQVIVKGSVFTSQGTSIPGAEIRLEIVNGDGSTRRLATSYASESGEFTFRRPAGAAKLRVTATFKGVSGSKEIEVSEPAIYRLAISLDLPK